MAGLQLALQRHFSGSRDAFVSAESRPERRDDSRRVGGTKASEGGQDQLTVGGGRGPVSS